MRYEYKELVLVLENDKEHNDVYNLKDLLMFALDLHVEHNCLSPEKERFCRALIDILDEDKGR